MSIAGMDTTFQVVFYISIAFISSFFFKFVSSDKIKIAFDKDEQIASKGFSNNGLLFNRNSSVDNENASQVCFPTFKYDCNNSTYFEDLGGRIEFNKYGCINSILFCNCATYDEVENRVEVGKCIYNCEYTRDGLLDGEPSYTALPPNASDWNVAFCGKFNRHGTLCGSCQNGTYSLAYSFNLSCIHCNNDFSNWGKYLFFAFFPQTLFYIVVLLFKISIFSGLLQGYVFYCQLVSSPAFARVALLSSKNSPFIFQALRVMGSFYGIWNLDFFRFYDLGLCLKTDTLATLSLDLAIAIYPLILIAITYFLIQVYDANFIVVVKFWKPFKAFFTILHNNWDIRASTVDSFATFLLLSNIKFLSVCMDILIPVNVIKLSTQENVANSSSWRVYYDASIGYFSRQHLPYAILAITVLITYILIPILVLLLYPFTACQYFLNKLPHRWQLVITTFVDPFQGSYKDGTKPNSFDYRCLSATPFILRLLTYIIYIITLNSFFLEFASIILVLFAIFTIQVDQFKNPSLSVNTIFFILLLAYYVVCMIGIDLSYTKFYYSTISVFFPMAFIGGSVPLFYVLTLVLIFIFNKRQFGLQIIARLRNRNYVNLQ